MAFEYMRDDPAAIAGACLLRISRLWGILPFQADPAESQTRRLMRHAVAAWYAGVLLLADVGCCTLGRRLWRSPWLRGVLLCLSWALIITPAISGAASKVAGVVRLRFLPLPPEVSRLLLLLSSAGDVIEAPFLHRRTNLLLGRPADAGSADALRGTGGRYRFGMADGGERAS